MKFYGKTDRGKVRKENQDSFILKKTQNDFVAAVVCDGMGGENAGKLASQTASEHFMKELLEGIKTETDIGALMLRSAGKANSAVFERASVDLSCRGMGTTLVAAVVGSDGSANVINIGDSRAYLIGRGRTERVTRDHSLVEELVSRGQITPMEARTHPQKKYITRALGVEAKAECDLFTTKLYPGQVMLLCSDGLSNLFPDEELLSYYTKRRDPKAFCRTLMKAALSRKATDNVTVVVIGPAGENKISLRSPFYSSKYHSNGGC